MTAALKAEIDRLTLALSDARMEIATLRNTRDDLATALEEARSALVTLGGDGGMSGGDPWADTIQRARLEAIDADLEKARRP